MKVVKIQPKERDINATVCYSMYWQAVLDNLSSYWHVFKVLLLDITLLLANIS